jgi:hypothetical protein
VEIVTETGIRNGLSPCSSGASGSSIPSGMI